MAKRDPYADKAPPPSFTEARNSRQKVRAAGMNPNYWYAVELDKNVGKEEVVEVVFWKRSIALFRDVHGELHAIENRCAHRQLKLTTGHVDGCNLVCPYHGWAYDGEGKVVDIPHSLFGRKFPKFQVPSMPVQVRYGLIWIFMGDAERQHEASIPEIPELEGPDRWTCVPVDATWTAHHSMIIDNVSDFTHAYLHRRYEPFKDAELTGFEVQGDTVELEYDTQVGAGKVSSLFVDRESVDTNQMKLAYEYPYQRSNTDDQIKHWLFVLPIDERTTRSFYLFYFKALKVPFTRFRIPRPVMTPFMHAANKLLVGKILDEDRVAVEAEQEGYEMHWDAPLAELNPVVKAFQDLTIRKWEEHLAETGGLAQLKTKKKTESSANA
ncbi:MAG: ring-hydroxylating oxygenase subunit alpha [Sandaracinus sp.]|nr:ring-hydroxylating oxygenase subunit alpha [Sandaracinus sp.]|tara:strand:- start:36 stop:1178 length:1143 start_codon:yes stop_codon:yes gene_type:complete